MFSTAVVFCAEGPLVVDVIVVEFALVESVDSVVAVSLAAKSRANRKDRLRLAVLLPSSEGAVLLELSAGAGASPDAA